MTQLPLSLLTQFWLHALWAFADKLTYICQWYPVSVSVKETADTSLTQGIFELESHQVKASKEATHSFVWPLTLKHYVLNEGMQLGSADLVEMEETLIQQLLWFSSQCGAAVLSDYCSLKQIGWVSAQREGRVCCLVLYFCRQPHPELSSDAALMSAAPECRRGREMTKIFPIPQIFSQSVGFLDGCLPSVRLRKRLSHVHLWATGRAADEEWCRCQLRQQTASWLSFARRPLRTPHNLLSPKSPGPFISRRDVKGVTDERKT